VNGEIFLRHLDEINKRHDYLDREIEKYKKLCGVLEKEKYLLEINKTELIDKLENQQR